MAKYHYEQRVFHELFSQNSIPTSPPPQTTQIASRLTTDTYVRSIHQPIVTCRIDESVSPPPDDWWTGARVILAVRFDSSGTSGAGSGPFSPVVVGNLELYPRIVGETPGSSLHYVFWEPLDGPLKLTTSRKGDGVNFPRITTSMWCTDHNAVFSNPGGIYSVKFSHRWTTLAIWASDSAV